MKYVAAYLLAVLGKKPNPSAKDIESILDSVGISADKGKLKQLLKELEGKDIHEVICAGREKMASVPTGGAAVAAGGASGGAGGGEAAPEKAEEVKEEEVEEEEEDMGFSLFDD